MMPHCPEPCVILKQALVHIAQVFAVCQRLDSDPAGLLRAKYAATFCQFIAKGPLLCESSSQLIQSCLVSVCLMTTK